MILSLVALALLVAFLYRFATNYDAKRQKLVTYIFTGGIEDDTLIYTENKCKLYIITYRTHKGDLDRYATWATNDLHAQINLIQEKYVAPFRILGVCRQKTL